MKLTGSSLRFTVAYSLVLSVCLYASSLEAGSDFLPLAQQPLASTAQDPPNILFMIDTSGSMNDPAGINILESRLSLAKSVVNDLLLSLSNVRVGLASFNSAASGAQIQVGINDISTNLGPMQLRLNALVASGGTPLAGSMLNLGRYFVQGSNQSLTLTPSNAPSSQKKAYTIFNVAPTYRAGVTALSPIQSFCQKSFVVMLTDGEPSANDPQPASSTGLTNYICSTIAGLPCGLVNTAAAMYQMDLRPDLTDPQGGSKKNNVVTYTIGFNNINANGQALLKATAENAGGVFFTASNADDLTMAFQSVTASILYQSVSAAALAFNSGSSASTTAVYQAQYRSSDWTGSLFRYPLNANGSLGVASWEAGTLLSQIPYNTRLVWTYNEDNNQPVLFKILGNLSQAQQCDLKANPTATSCNASDGQAKLNYLVGDRSNEQTATNSTKPYRERKSLLGDIVNSTPLYIGPSQSNWPDNLPFPTGANRYSLFKKTIASLRIPVVYVGANEGMLHAFNAQSGQEMMAYIPGLLSEAFREKQPANGEAATLGLHYLTSPNYAHRFYVDGSPVAQDVYIRTRTNGLASWRTILMGGLHSGGRGYYDLDVTQPSLFNAGNLNSLLLWEFSAADTKEKASDPELLGYSFAPPQIGLMNNGRWAAIFPNGYNTPGSDDATLFIVYLDGGLDGVWTRGSDYLILSTRSGPAKADNVPNTLGVPATVDLDGNGTIDRVYAGDLNGDLWAFDLSSTSTSQWKVAYGPSNNPKPLFKGLSTQPITAQPVVATNPIISTNADTSPNVLVLVGTGRLVNTNDKADQSSQSFYGIWDSGQDSLARKDLVKQTVTQLGAYRFLTNYSVPYGISNPGQRRYGWMIDFAGGERVLFPAAVVNVPIRQGIFEPSVIFNTYTPNNTNEACVFGGSATTFLVKLENGGQPSEAVLDINNDSQITPLDNINNQVVSGVMVKDTLPSQPQIRGDYLFVPLSEGKITKIRLVNSTFPLGQWSWEDIGVK